MTAGNLAKTVIRDTYVHFGEPFQKEKFEPIRNRAFTNKPYGGFWASAENSKYGWKKWCTENKFNISNLKTAFRFVLDNPRTLVIDSLDKAQKLPDRGDFPGEFGLRLCYPILPDFEALVENFDVIDFHISKDKRLYRALYGWDCDSILVMNPNIIQKL